MVIHQRINGTLSSPTPWRRQRDEVLCPTDSAAALRTRLWGEAPGICRALGWLWDGLDGLGCGDFLNISPTKLSEFTLQKNEQVYSVHFV